MIKTYNELPMIAKVLLQIFLGWLISPVYRIVRYFDTKNILTLVVGIICCFGGMVIFWWVDLITIILNNKIQFFAD